MWVCVCFVSRTFGGLRIQLSVLYFLFVWFFFLSHMCSRISVRACMLDQYIHISSYVRVRRQQADLGWAHRKQNNSVLFVQCIRSDPYPHWFEIGTQRFPALPFSVQIQYMESELKLLKLNWALGSHCVISTIIVTRASPYAVYTYLKKILCKTSYCELVYHYWYWKVPKCTLRNPYYNISIRWNTTFFIHG